MGSLREVEEGWTLGSFSLVTESQVDWWNRQPDRHDLGTIIHELKLEGFQILQRVRPVVSEENPGENFSLDTEL